MVKPVYVTLTALAAALVPAVIVVAPEAWYSELPATIFRAAVAAEPSIVASDDATVTAAPEVLVPATSVCAAPNVNGWAPETATVAR